MVVVLDDDSVDDGGIEVVEGGTHGLQIVLAPKKQKPRVTIETIQRECTHTTSTTMQLKKWYTHTHYNPMQTC